MSNCFVKLADVKKILCDSCQEECEKTTCDYQAVLSELREKAVDAEPVVRCKDCIHWCEYSGCEELVGKGWCDVAYGETTHALFFCGTGEKMDEEG